MNSYIIKFNGLTFTSIFTKGDEAEAKAMAVKLTETDPLFKGLEVESVTLHSSF